MATIGLDKLHYAPITEDSETGAETYGTPKKLAEVINVELSVENAEATLYADDTLSESAREFAGGTISINTKDISPENLVELLGATLDKNGVVLQNSEDTPKPVALGFRAKKSNGLYRYFWIYRVLFGTPSTTLNTKGESIEFQTPTIEGTIMARKKADSNDKHPWKAEVIEGETGTAAAIASWFTEVYEPQYNTETGQSI